jgi:aspartate 1-decarboxylase
MQLELVRSKIHRVLVTEADVDYEGSVCVDVELLIAADIVQYELVHIWNVTRGTRLITYAIEAPAGSGEIKTNGGAALHNLKGDIIIIAAFAQFEPHEARQFSPTIVLVDEKNKIKSIKQSKVVVNGHVRPFRIRSERVESYGGF